jgi:hypothetical protein
MGKTKVPDPKKRQRICATYAENRSLHETGRVFRLSPETVGKIIDEVRPDLRQPAKGRGKGRQTAGGMGK